MGGLLGLVAFGAFGVVAAIAEGEFRSEKPQLIRKSRSKGSRK
ncbi:MAG TPA: hypothetical protein V6C85_22230 [Allocoleopsis sp.]